MCPFAQGGLDEAFSFSIGSGCVGPGEALPDVEFAHGVAVKLAVVAGPVVAVDALDGEAIAVEVSLRHEEEPERGVLRLVWHDGGEADARVVVDGDMEVLVASAAGALAGVAGDPVPRCADDG